MLAVFTARDVDVPDLPPEVGTVNQNMTQPLLAGDVVRYVGEPVAAVVAASRAAAVDAAELVEVDDGSRWRRSSTPMPPWRVRPCMRPPAPMSLRCG